MTAEQRANKLWKRMLAEYVDPGLDPALDEAIKSFMAARKAELGDSIDEE